MPAEPSSTPAPSPPTGRAWWASSPGDVAAALSTSATTGLTAAEAAARLLSEGPNSIGEAKRRSALLIFLGQFRSLIVGLLLAAGVIAVVMGDIAEAVAVAVVILLNASIGFATEWQAARALRGLRKHTVPVARVVRDGQEHQVPAEDLVTGDVVHLAAGDRVPADGRVIEGVQLQVDEASLTGEAIPVTKAADADVAAAAVLADRTTMVHTGTTITDGRASMLVTATGAHTELGTIGALLDSVTSEGTPLEAKLAQLSRALLVIVGVLCVVIILFGWLRGNDLLFMTEVGISLAIAAVPEGLLAVTTMTLAIGMQRMARMRALVRRLPAVEALGSTTVICTDKTGTLTRNEMTVRAYAVGGQRVSVSGTGYRADGAFAVDDEAVTVDADADTPLALALRIGALCNDATIDVTGEEPTVLGDPTEAALTVAAQKAGLDMEALKVTWPRTAEVPFSSETKMMVTVHEGPRGRVAFVKGAPSAVLKACVAIMGTDGVTPLTPALVEAQQAKNAELAAAALRVLGLAWRELGPDDSEADAGRGLTFVGYVGMIDPLRDEAKATIATCREAGIRIIMITGDQQATAKEIAHQLGIDVDADDQPLRTVHARELVDLDADGLRDVVKHAAVVARASPKDKLRIVEALQAQGHVVAMTGDGVNDAPALHKADIGIAMGIRGTEVAKDASDMVITDDNFATIIGAVEQGRIIVNNLLRFIHYLFSSNFAEITTVFVAIMVGWPLPLGVLQILWLNVVTDTFPAMALALEPSAADVMRDAPRDPKQPLMTPRFGWLIVWQGSLLGVCTLAVFALGLRWYGATGVGLQHATTMTFMTLAWCQIFHAFNVRSRRGSAFTSAFTNRWLWASTVVCLALQVAAVAIPPLRTLLKTVPLTMVDWGVVAVASLMPVVVVEIVKVIARLRPAPVPTPTRG